MIDLPRATLGRTGLQVTTLGYGAMELRGASGLFPRGLDSAQAGAVLGGVLDAGINFIDTAPDYGEAEAQIGAAISHRRDEFFLASKCGCPVGFGPQAPGQRPPHDFSARNVRAGVEQSLRRMKTDHLDLVQFHHGPPRDVLESSGSLEELEKLKQEGKVRFIGVSSTLPVLQEHIAMGVFDTFQIPYSALERDHERAIDEAATAGAGVIVRGGVARAVAKHAAFDLERVPERMREMVSDRRGRWDAAGLGELLGDMTRQELMLRFTLSHPGMATTIVGTQNPAHLAENVAAARKGPLPADVYHEALRRLDALDQAS